MTSRTDYFWEKFCAPVLFLCILCCFVVGSFVLCRWLLALPYGGCTCLTCEFPTDLSSLAGDLHSFQDFLISQKQSLSALPEMAEKLASIDAALHELDLYLFGEGLV